MVSAPACQHAAAVWCSPDVVLRAASACRPDAALPALALRVVLRPVATLKRRQEFLRIRGGARWANASFVIETRPRDPADSHVARIGYTVTKQIGNAVVRNRVRRRFREAMRLCDRALLKAGHDYVLIARNASLQRGFTDLRAELEAALGQIFSGKAQGNRPRGAGGKKSGRTSRNSSDDRA
jgi:ribonuclease P protein component